MWDLIERGCEMPAWARGLLFIMLTGAAWGTPWLLVNTSASMADEQAAWRAQWQRLRPLINLENRPSPEPSLPFTVTDVQQAGVVLERWQPEANGGRLTLTSDWQSLPALFSLLAGRGMLVTAFTLTPATDALSMALQLERQHAE